MNRSLNIPAPVQRSTPSLPSAVYSDGANTSVRIVSRHRTLLVATDGAYMSLGDTVIHVCVSACVCIYMDYCFLEVSESCFGRVSLLKRCLASLECRKATNLVYK